MTRVLIAADKFKGTLTAVEVATAVAAGLRRVGDPEIRVVPVADGGDGTVAAALEAGFETVGVTAAGPTGEPVETAYARQGETAVIEMADVSGLVRLPGGRLDPLRATSRGLGEVIAAAIDAGCHDVVVGIGGSASTDGGAGMVQALGAWLTDDRGSELGGGGVGLSALAAVDLRGLRRRIKGVRFTFACDVNNPLTGPRGAAAVYGPQKGARPDDVAVLDAALEHWADVIAAETGRDEREAPGAGAAGGVGYAAVALLGAALRPGIDLVLDLVGFREALAALGPDDLVITGEGALDEQTLHGKAPAGVAAAARARGIPVVAVCGQNGLGSERLEQAGISAAYALVDVEPDVTRCMTEPAPILERLGERIARDRLATQSTGQ
ncbi:glycerate kinase [Intrasporangium chromatireducens Q5-1]|uniref:Glycerate kinase n=1 Tax=Intrasporangium chromatireducens Q5-1 TaxID=584657 RepID=W9GIJ6_9MICO|nr:glycerate kinase [Intrasporangium chromatireducens]EWT04628.1 glycerate kinase [Intrasporangium chromatireducens Q5-1]